MPIHLTDDNNNVVASNKVVTVTYALIVFTYEKPEKELVQEATADQPFAFLCASGTVLEDFEKELLGKTIGDTFELTIVADNAYGPYNEEAVGAIPVDVFKQDGQPLDANIIKPGAVLPMVGEDNERVDGLVLEVNDEFVFMDFNHPLAGQNLHFTGSILAVRNATDEELAHGHAHGEGGHNH